MRRFFQVLALILVPFSAKADPEALGLALDAIAAGDIGLASQAAMAIDDPVAQDIVEWQLLRRGGQPWADYVAFLDRNADWPGLPYMRGRGESEIPGDADPEIVIAYFATQPPVTGAGALALANAYLQTGDRASAEAAAIRGWTTLGMTGTDAGRLRDAFGAVLNDEDLHVARLDHLLWENIEERARAMFPLVPEGWQALAEARLALRDRRPGVDDAINAVPAALSDDAGLAYERFLWRIRSGFWDTAGELMVERSISAEALGRPTMWGDRRADLARDVMREGDFDTCYTYAANHFIEPEDDSTAFAELEWLAGYCALRRGEAETAIGHFDDFREVVVSPISVGRAGYWLGRAHEAAGNTEAAASAYELGAQFQSSFYGQLAAERGGFQTDPTFMGNENYGDWRQASFTGSEIFHAGLLLYEAGQGDLAERFLTHLTESLDRAEAGQLGDFALEIGDPHIALGIAKRAAQAGFEIMRPYYPLTALAEADLPAPDALVLSIARRESEFNPNVVSGAGALGLMQVMPGTGRDTARDIGLPYSEQRLRDDPAYNALLGATFLSGLIDRFDGNLVLVAAAYNAGPARADQWIERFGDPRRADDIVDWIEAIPFTETRNYIMRVTESIPIYEAQLTGTVASPSLAARLSR